MCASTLYFGSCITLWEICSLLTPTADKCKQRHTCNWTGTAPLSGDYLDTACSPIYSHAVGSPGIFHLSSWKLAIRLPQIVTVAFMGALTTNPISGVSGSSDCPPLPHRSQDVMKNSGWLSRSQMWRKAWDKGFIDGHKLVALLFQLQYTHTGHIHASSEVIKRRTISPFKRS